ncbi:MAG: hypothetical protein ACLP3K_05695 [Candidatus Acidiferrales bacterium]
MFESKNLANNALDEAIYDRLCSLVYVALNTALNDFDDPKAQTKEWRGLGAPAFAHVLVISASPNWASYSGAFWMDPWIAEYLRPYTAEGLTHIVEKWLKGKPLAPHISEDPADEDLKVKRLKSLLNALDGHGEP